MKVLQMIGSRLIREPVLLFGAIAASIAAWLPQLVDTDLEKAAVAAILLYLQRSFSTSKANLDDQVNAAQDAARDKALADVASLKAPAKPVKKTAKKS